jgi:RNA polymerase sigma-70 factor (ECF subfamily)
MPSVERPCDKREIQDFPKKSSTFSLLAQRIEESHTPAGSTQMADYHQSDEELMREVKLSERSALSILLRRYANPLLTFLVRMTSNYHQSEELFQEVFLAVWTSRERYEFPRSFRNWLFGIAANKCHAEFRNRRPEEVTLRRLELEHAAETFPADRLIAAETWEQVEQTLDELPLQQRTVVVMRIWNGLSFERIAEVMNITEGTARSHLCHALKTLRGRLAAPQGESCPPKP